MNTFTISQLAQFAGVKPHTIRVWEQRYQALQPARSEGNTRYYDNSQLRRLLNMVSLVSQGYRVSEVCKMKDEQLFAAVSGELQSASSDPRDEYFISQLVAAGMAYDEASFEKLLGHCFLRYEPRGVYERIIYPVLQRTGLLWATDQVPPATEHFMTHLIRQKLLSAIDALPYAPPGAESWICFLPEDEFHEIGLLFASYMLRAARKKVIYLGSNLPFDSLAEVIKLTNPTHLLTFLVTSGHLAYIEELAASFKKLKVFVAAGEASQHETVRKTNVRYLKSAADLERELQSNDV